MEAQTGKTVWFRDPWVQMNAIRIDTPPGWKAVCDIVWDFNNPAIPCKFWLKASSADDRKGLEVFPGENFNCSPQPMQQHGRGRPYMGQVLLEQHKAADFLRRRVIPRFRTAVSGLKEVGSESLYKIAQQASAQAQMPVDAASVTVSYRDASGVEIKEMFLCAIVYISINNYCGWQPLIVISSKYPKGANEAADEREIETIASTLVLNPDWSAKHVQMREAISKRTQNQLINTREAAGRYAREGARASEARSNVIKERTEATARVKEGWDDVLSGNERFVDSSGKEYVESTYRAQGWINSLGETVYTSNNSTYNPNFDPNLSGSWDRLKVK